MGVRARTALERNALAFDSSVAVEFSAEAVA